MIPAPSPITKPSRFLSNGLLAVFGSGFVERAVLAQKPATDILVIGASAPPDTITSASPRWITLKASPIEFVPVAQAVTVHELNPRAPSVMETWPVAISGINIGTKKGLTRL